MASRNINDKLSLFVLSPATIIFAILSIAIFIYYGAKGLFYAFVFITIIIGIANAWSISRIGTYAENVQLQKAPIKRTSKRKAARKRLGGIGKSQRKIKR